MTDSNTYSISHQKRLAAISFNNAAISEMELGNHENCIRMLSNSLKRMNKEVSTVQQVDSLQPFGTDGALDCQISSLLRIVGGCEQMDNGKYMFTRLLSIPRTAARDPQSRALLIKVIIFNLGLSHHLAAFATHNDRASKYLVKARKLYQICYNFDAHTMQPETARHLLPALLNNMGVICCQLCNRKLGVQSFHGLLTMVIQANSFGDSPYSKNDNIYCFLANVSELVHHQCIPAAAA